MSFVAERAVRSHAFTLARAVREAFALFTPEGERAWAQGWEPLYLFPRDGRAEAGNRYIRELDEARYRDFIDGWKNAIEK